MMNDGSINTRKKLFTGIMHFSLVLTTIILVISINKCKNLHDINIETNNLYNAANDSIIKYKNKLNQEVTKTSVLSTTNVNLLLNLKTKDRDVIELQNMLKQAKKENKELSSALVIRNATIISLKDSLHNIITGWTQPNKDSCYRYPIYSKDFSIDSCYTKGHVSLGLTSFNIDLKVNNDFDVSIGEEKDGWFKKKQFAEIVNKNKCTTTTNLKVYDKKEKKTNIIKPFGIGVIVGVVILKIFL